MEKQCCVEARRELIQAQSIMSAFSTINPLHREAEKVRDDSQSHLTKCAEPRRRALAAKIVSRLYR